ncbi:hypothetical protein BDZ85DRAFT_101665 [Elsinoe ampelina]|uniref:Uncharacterized protein n=1 Tax=Elsinoe ampelina TaxID=302913 RepID=A0A6A6GFJ7_9PEZI|nr:hypothetical protein BDZ85DRAFT_101665 [Elsinoe ampelina]
MLGCSLGSVTHSSVYYMEACQSPTQHFDHISLTHLNTASKHSTVSLFAIHLNSHIAHPEPPLLLTPSTPSAHHLVSHPHDDHVSIPALQYLCLTSLHNHRLLIHITSPLHHHRISCRTPPPARSRSDLPHSHVDHRRYRQDPDKGGRGLRVTWQCGSCVHE